MEISSLTNQRETYKLVEKLTSKEFKNDLELLSSVIHDIVDNPEFEINGGRIWELDLQNRCYKLKSQYGKMETIPDGYQFSLDKHQDIFKMIEKERTTLNYETDQILLESGITIYSVTGVGEIYKDKKGKYYQYLLGFNAPEILQTFFETLMVISSVLTIALKDLLKKVEQERIKDDYITASEIQNNLLPEHHIRFQDYDIYGICVPLDAVGGDYFDYFMQSDDEEESIGIVISDAASKGLPAAIQALFVSGAIRMAKRFSPSLTHLISGLNTLIFDTFSYERIVTLFYCELTNSSNRLVLYVNAGHCPPIHYRPETDSIKLLGSTGGLLGLMQYQKFGVENVRLHKGDILLLYTDGITEARNQNGEFYGEERLQKMVIKNRDGNSERIAQLILEDVQKFSASSQYSDDKTLVVIKRDA